MFEITHSLFHATVRFSYPKDTKLALSYFKRVTKADIRPAAYVAFKRSCAAK